MTLPDRMKFRVESPAHSEAVQKALFALGCRWNFYDMKTDTIKLRNDENVQLTTEPYIIVYGKEIYYIEKSEVDENVEIFNEHENTHCVLVKGQIVEGDHGPWDGFIPWFGGECPVDVDVKVNVLVENNSFTHPANTFDWRNTGKFQDIIAYRVVEEAQEILEEEKIQKEFDKLHEDLLPCPFCGGKPFLQIHEPHTHLFATFMPYHSGSATIECCGGLIADTVEEVKARWNKRHVAQEKDVDQAHRMQELAIRGLKRGCLEMKAQELGMTNEEAATLLDRQREQDRLDAQRYRWLKEYDGYHLNIETMVFTSIAKAENTIDLAIAAKGEA